MGGWWLRYLTRLAGVSRVVGILIQNALKNIVPKGYASAFQSGMKNGFMPRRWIQVSREIHSRYGGPRLKSLHLPNLDLPNY